MYKFYSNFHRKMKFLGIISYDYLVYIVLIFVVILKACEIVNVKWTTTIYILIIIMIPIITLLYSVSASNEQNKYAVLNLLKYVLSNKKYTHMPISKIEYIKRVVKNKIK